VDVLSWMDDFRLTIEIAQLVGHHLGGDAVFERADKFFGRARSRSYRRFKRSLKRPLEKLDTFRLARIFGIMGRVFVRSTVLRRCHRVEHLQWISLTNSNLEDSARPGNSDRWRGLRFLRK
jgi:hypothetical protein